MTTPTRPSKNPTSMRLSPEASDLIAALAKRYGISRASIVEMAVRALKQGLDSFRHPIYTDEEAFMRALGMLDEDIAWVMAQPVEPAPDEVYEQVEGIPGMSTAPHGDV